MAPTKVLARGWTFEVKSDQGIFIAIKGVNSFELSPAANKTETTDFDSNGWVENMVASRGLTLSLEGFYLEDPDTGARDPGQLRVEEIGGLIGPESIGEFRMTSPGGRVKTFFATANVTTPGGGNDDAASWSAEIEVTGQPIDSTATLISITVLPDPAAITNPGTLQFTAIGVYSNGSSRDITSLASWSSDTPATATIAAGGLATSVGAGTSEITASLGGKSDTVTLTVS
jgi:hypothetical protein